MSPYLISPRRVVATGAAVALVCSIAPAFGQTRSAVPTPPQTPMAIPGLRTIDRSDQVGQTLTLDAAVSTGLDKMTAADAAGLTLFTRDVTATGTTGSVAYDLGAKYLSARLFAAGNGRHFSGGSRWAFSQYGGGDLRVVLPLGPRTSLGFRAGGSYQPVSASLLFPDLFRPDGPPPLPTEFDLAAPVQTFLATDLGVSLSRTLSRRSAFSMALTQQLRGSVAGGETERLHEGSVGYGRTISRSLALRLGYRYTERQSTRGSMAADSAVVPVTYHTGDLGIDFNRTLSFSRQTSLSISTGTLAASERGRTQAELTGTVGLSHRFARYWSTGLTYDRNVNFIQSFTLPTFADSLSMSLDGQPWPRVTVTAGAGVSVGRLGLVSTGNEYRATQTAVGATFDIIRLLSLRVDYAYYRYRFSSSAFLPVGIGTNVRRHHLQVGTGVTLPLLGRARSRRTNAAR